MTANHTSVLRRPEFTHRCPAPVRGTILPPAASSTPCPVSSRSSASACEGRASWVVMDPAVVAASQARTGLGLEPPLHGAIRRRGALTCSAAVRPAWGPPRGISQLHSPTCRTS